MRCQCFICLLLVDGVTVLRTKKKKKRKRYASQQYWKLSKIANVFHLSVMKIRKRRSHGWDLFSRLCRIACRCLTINQMQLKIYREIIYISGQSIKISSIRGNFRNEDTKINFWRESMSSGLGIHPDYCWKHYTQSETRKARAYISKLFKLKNLQNWISMFHAAGD